MSQRLGEHVIIVCMISAVGLFIGNTIGGLFAGLPFMVIAGVLCRRHMDLFVGKEDSPKDRKTHP